MALAGKALIPTSTSSRAPLNLFPDKSSAWTNCCKAGNKVWKVLTSPDLLFYKYGNKGLVSSQLPKLKKKKNLLEELEPGASFLKAN